MSIEALMLVCTAILTAFGVLDSALRSFKMSRFAVIMFSLTMLALKQFTLSPVHEITINMAAAVMPFLFLCREKPKAFFLRGFFTVVYVAGLAGVTYYLGYFASIQPRTLASTGFDAIAVALLGNSSPIGIIFSSFLITVISKGSTYMSSASGVQPEIASAITGVILLFSACSAFVKYKLDRWKEERR